jgi:hypothetical protein
MMPLDTRISCVCSCKKDSPRLTHLALTLCRSPASSSVAADLLFENCSGVALIRAIRSSLRFSCSL